MDIEIRLTADEADVLLEILNDVVVSLDRIGSREASGEDPEHNWIHEYFSPVSASNSPSGETYRVQIRRRFHDEARNLEPTRGHNPNSPSYDPSAADATHVP
jgi:hypothetical protein